MYSALSAITRHGEFFLSRSSLQQKDVAQCARKLRYASCKSRNLSHIGSYYGSILWIRLSYGSIGKSPPCWVQSFLQTVTSPNNYRTCIVSSGTETTGAATTSNIVSNVISPVGLLLPWHCSNHAKAQRKRRSYLGILNAGVQTSRIP